jgi:hypothetical protein
MSALLRAERSQQAARRARAVDRSTSAASLGLAGARFARAERNWLVCATARQTDGALWRRQRHAAGIQHNVNRCAQFGRHRANRCAPPAKLSALSRRAPHAMLNARRSRAAALRGPQHGPAAPAHPATAALSRRPRSATPRLSSPKEKRAAKEKASTLITLSALRGAGLRQCAHYNDARPLITRKALRDKARRGQSAIA